MKEDPTGSFITTLLELKLDKDTIFEWCKTTKTTPHYDDLLAFLDLRAQGSETSSSELKKRHSSRQATPKSATSLAANA